MTRAMGSCRARWLAVLFALVVAAAAGAAAPAREVHGSSDAYAEPGLVLAWAIRRGADENSTRVVLRIVADPARYARVAVAGIDPFSKAERGVLAATPTAGLSDLAVARSHYADFPHTAVRLFAAGASDDAPSLVVFFHGVPDTTPEFAADAALDRYLAERIDRARRTAGAKP